MKISNFVISLIGVTLLAGNLAQAHTGHEHSADMRVWRDADGLFEIEGTFMLQRDDKIRLGKHDGTLIWVPLSRLSTADREWVRNRMAQIRRTSGDDSASESTTPVATGPLSTIGDGEIRNLTVLSILGCLAFIVLLAGFRRRKVARLPVAALTALLFVVSLRPISAENENQGHPPAIMKHFEVFKDKLQFRCDSDNFYVGSNGFPDHPMMIGIKAWQQQVPLPQPYSGRNAWQIPLHPKLAARPISGRNALFSGAIALAVNGVPIFNALNNRGEDTYLAGELDEYGGHCGRGDDYHYHIAPVHLEKTVGKGDPIAYALDGFPLHGYTDADGKVPTDLDEFNGRMHKDGYRYYSTKTFPYINGGMRGVVKVRNDRIDPQPKDAPIRPAGQPLRGAKITDFVRDDVNKTYTLKYDFRGVTQSIRYRINDDGTYTFVYRDGSGRESTETYRRREEPEAKKKDTQKKKKNEPPPRKEAAINIMPQTGTFRVSSPAFEHGGNIPVEFTGDGAGISPPITWTGAPEGTK